MSNLLIDWGATCTLDTTIPAADLPANGLAGFTLTFYAKRSRTDSDASAYITKTPAITTAGTQGSQDGLISTPLVPADTNGLPLHTVALYWRIVATDPNGVSSVPDEGLLVVEVG